jgi:hypothetical protein
MAKYDKKSQTKVKRAMHEMKSGKLKSGGSGKTVKSRKQAIAIGLSEARKEGSKAPKKATSKSKTQRGPVSRKKTSRKKTTTRSKSKK